MLPETEMLHSKAHKIMLHSPCKGHVWYMLQEQPVSFDVLLQSIV